MPTLTDKLFARVPLTLLHRNTGGIIEDAAHGLPTLVERRGRPFVLILPAKDMSSIVQLAADVAEQMDDEAKRGNGGKDE